jgi:hypothetical protein
MRPITSTGVRRPALPTLADLQRRGAELLGSQPPHQAEQEPPPAIKQPYSAAPAPRRPPDCSYPRLPAAASWPRVSTVPKPITALPTAASGLSSRCRPVGDRRGGYFSALLALLALLAHFYLAKSLRNRPAELSSRLLRLSRPAVERAVGPERSAVERLP